MSAMSEAIRLYIEHRDTELHTGDTYIEDCPTCNPEAGERFEDDWIEWERGGAVTARIGGNEYRRRAYIRSLIDLTPGSGAALALRIERFAPSFGQWTKTWGTGSPPSDAER